jgi:hypothetical protein
MRIVFTVILIISLVLVILIPAGLVIMVFDLHPHVRISGPVDGADIQRARQILAPLKSSQEESMPVTSLTISETDLNLLISYGLTQFADAEKLAFQAHLFPETAVVYASIQVLDIFPIKWINLAAAVHLQPGKLKIQQLRVGRIRVPDPIVQWMADLIHARGMDSPRYAHAISVAQQIQTLDIDKDRLTLEFQWNPLILATLTGEAKKQLFSSKHQNRLVEYHNYLVKLSSSFRQKKQSLSAVMKPMFRRAMENTALSQDPVSENTAILQVMAAYVMNQDLAGFLAPDIRQTVSSSRPEVVFVLYGREDLAQHFLSSAAITVLASGTLARSMGMAKEMEDAQTKSGYSFVDISANEAGIRLAEFAMSGPVNARLLQQRAAELSRENQFMPDINHLPENLSFEAFQNQFNSPDSAAFARIMHQIESSIDACHIYQN